MQALSRRFLALKLRSLQWEWSCIIRRQSSFKFLFNGILEECIRYEAVCPCMEFHIEMGTGFAVQHGPTAWSVWTIQVGLENLQNALQHYIQ